ncbi:sigma-70 family RNA polymerase sigma factor [Streptomyces sp. CMB-StM0423]|uniref:sigma-70 family RNA polymerase sigma factor n=1 Tax=Streptomyces sp. CMB-StM0423 TaxID=2059884 RepID=UPI00131A7A62|nr:sigma-70 family RNA polymerase sigma factor [Streptomyces sp. CMB-StM0423]
MSESPTAFPASGAAPGDADLTALIRDALPGTADAALDELYRRHRAAVLAYARSCTRDPHTAEDLTSEAFAGALRAVRGGSGPDGPWRPYLLTTVRRTAAAWSRTARRTELSPDFEGWLTRAPTVESTEEGTLRREDANLVLRAFRSLPERWQTALWHSAVEGEPPDRIATLLGLTASGVASLTARAREGLREAYLAERAGEAGAPAECRHYTGLLAASVRRGGRRRRGQRGLEHHLAVCRRCRRTSAELRELNSSLTAALPVGLLLWTGASYGADGAGSSGGTEGTGGASGTPGAPDSAAAGAGSGTPASAASGAAPAGGTASAAASGTAGGATGASGAVTTLGSAATAATAATGGAASTGLAAAVKAAAVGAAVLAIVVTGYTTLPGGGDPPPPPPAPTATTAAPTPTAERSTSEAGGNDTDPDDPPSTASADRTKGPDAAEDRNGDGGPDRKPTASDGGPPAGDDDTGPPPDWSPPADDRTALPVAATGRCMDIGGAAGDQPYEADCDGGRSQQWELLVSLPPVQEVRIRNHATGMCLTHSGTDADGAPVSQQQGACRSDESTAHWKYFLEEDDKVVFTQRDSSGQFLGLDDWRAAAEGRPHAPDIGTTANYEATPSLRFRYRGPAFGY